VLHLNATVGIVVGMKRDTTSRKLKAANISPFSARKPQWAAEHELAKKAREKTVVKPQRIAKKKKMKKGTSQAIVLSDDALMQAARERASGESLPDLAKRYGISSGYLAQCLKRVYVNTDVGRQILKGMLLENGIVTAAHAQKKLNELTGMQAAVASGIFTSRFIELDKHIQTSPQKIDFAKLDTIMQTLNELDQLVAHDLDDDGDITDIEAEVTPLDPSRSRS